MTHQGRAQSHRLTTCPRHPTDTLVTGFCASCLRECLAGIDPSTHQEIAGRRPSPPPPMTYQGQAQSHRLTTCPRHPTNTLVTGICASCLRERLAGIDPSTHQEPQEPEPEESATQNKPQEPEPEESPLVLTGYPKKKWFHLLDLLRDPQESATRNKPQEPEPEESATQNKPQEPEQEESALVWLGNPAKRFDLEDLFRASVELLGRGTVGTSYKAHLDDGTTVVVVKRLKLVVLSAEDFRDRVVALGAMDHENLLPLRGYYYSKDEKLLLYDYMPLRSLSSQLHGSRGSGRTPLSWEVRLSIALGAARAIEHLHAQRRPNIHHGNIKSSNVLLMLSCEVRVSDYGLAPLTSSALVGGADPTMADVYGFGVLLLELLTGKLPTQPPLRMEEGVDLPAWVVSVVREEWTDEVFDLEIKGYDDVKEEMVQLLQLALSCVSPNSHERPQMSEVRRKIEELCSPGGQRDGDSLPDKVSEGTKDTSSGLIPSAQVDRDTQLNQFSEVNNDIYTR